MRLLLTRHGQTPSNIRHVLDTVPPGPGLTEEGHRQAADLAEAMIEQPITAVYASTATRAQETAAPLAEKLGLPVTVLEGLHEIFVGDVEGRNDHDALMMFHDASQRWVAGELAVRCANGESAEEVIERATKAFDALHERHGDETILLVSHGGLIRLVAGALADNVSAELGLQRLDNTAQVVLDTDGDTWHCHSWSGIEF